MNTWTKSATAVLLGAISLGVAANPTAQRAGNSIGAFVCYFQALGRPDAPAGFWERLTVSLALAGAASERPGHAHNRPGPRPAML